MAAAQEIAATITDVAPAGLLTRLTPSQRKSEEASFSRGKAGLALLFAYLGEARHDAALSENAIRLVDESIDAVGEVEMSASLLSGFTGVAWTIAHLQGRLLESEEDPNSATKTDISLALETCWSTGTRDCGRYRRVP